MKTISTALVLLVLAISGCKKDYTCICNTTDTFTTGSTTTTDVGTTTTYINKAKKSDANFACSNYESTTTSSNYTSTYKSTCTLKK